MRVLLDSCTFLWLDSAPARLAPAARACLQDPSTVRVVSHASLWELGIKHAAGKLPLVGTLHAVIERYESAGLIELLPIAQAHIYRSVGLPWIHRDPFDRLIVAQSLIEGLPLLTADSRMSEYGVQTIWE